MDPTREPAASVGEAVPPMGAGPSDGSTPPSSSRRAPSVFGAFTRAELGALLALCGVYGLRLAGLYMVLPVLSLYARGLPGSTSFLTGLSLGAYGFTNMLLVLPYGILSDAIGRKRAIVIGLAVFAGGSLVAAFARDIGWLLAGRALQGAGAVSSVVVALVGDLTRPQVRARAMALLGMSVAGAFAVGVIGGPSLAGEFGVSSLFLLTGILSLAGLGLVLVAVPHGRQIAHHDEYEPRVRDLRSVLLQPALLKLDASMFVIHLSITALFVVVPILLDRLLPTYHLWRVYAPIVLLGIAIMLPTMIYAERARAVHKVLYAGIGLFGAAFLVLGLAGTGLAGIVAGLALFVVAFGLLEPTLTTLLTRYTTRAARGTAAGLFNMSGFLGAFVGGVLGGLLLETQRDLFLVLVAVALVWLLAALRMPHEEARPIPSADGA